MDYMHLCPDGANRSLSRQSTKRLIIGDRDEIINVYLFGKEDRMNQRQLYYFVTVMDCGSIKSAADVLSITPQGLSKTIISLEEEMGCKLFARTKHGVTPTTDARRLKPYALRILHAYDDLDGEMRMDSYKKRIFTVAVTYGVICLLGTEFIEAFYQKNPSVRLNLVELTDDPAMEKLESGEAELAILAAPLDTTRFEGIPVFSARHCMIINEQNPLSSKDYIQYFELNHQPLALKGREYRMYNTNINRFLVAGAAPEIYIETSNDTLIADLAENNIAIGVSLDYIAAADRRKGTRICYFADEDCRRTLYLAQNVNANLSDVACSFRNLLLDHFQRLDENLPPVNPSR